MEVYVRRFDGTGEKTRISGAGGSRPCWRRDGQELFYLSGGNEVMAVPIVGGATLKAGNAKALFRVAAPGWNGYGNAFDVAPDGERFLVQTGVGGASLMPFVMVRNWEAAGRLKEDGGGLGR
jgi:hypothetical protein